MKKIFLLSAGVGFSVLLSAQVKPAPVTTPVVKQTPTVKSDSNNVKIQVAPAASGIKRALPVSVNEMLVFYKWKATRWIYNGLVNGPFSVPFTFNANGTMSCSDYFVPVLSTNETLTGTYTVSGNNITITIKKDSTAIMTCDIVYDNSTQKFNGNYSYTLLSGYNAGGTGTGVMKMEKTQ
ncbi:MAG: hypothetical protein U0V75_12545 [Ferruginibacter sp.]